jgi:polyisoprenoid-binding protein YceI
LIYFFGGAEPAEVDLDSTIDAVSNTTEAGSSTSAAATATTNAGTSTGALTDASGTWSVDTTTGTFSFEEATASFAGFRVEEELAQIGAATAVGRTPDVSGTVTIDGTTITAAAIEVDLTTIVSNENRRDDNIQEALNTNQNPTATFVLTEPLDFGEVPVEGVTLSAVATGELTINGVTRTVDIPLQAQVVGDAILVVGSTEVLFSDFDVETPSAQMVLSVADLGIIELQLWLVRS